MSAVINRRVYILQEQKRRLHATARRLEILSRDAHSRTTRAKARHRWATEQLNRLHPRP